ncbi:KH domain-containing, RNA-binding, signal transduction-associated protein 3 [Ochotona curzoniae]|uniref:KH domain-containing, RNA-binding, signal transduction-associated protein 3 n=1 Tax=Ochotona curzoniae TaxID=130825 RepID=UPI001B346FB4|nr:KH domain-containing, RNA-binding, signal transduction-associated protein 3 [Ochotona curzoniae]
MWQGSEDAIEGLPYIKGSMYIQVLARLLISSSQKYNQGGEGESVQMSHYRQMVSGKFPLLQSKWIDARDSGIGKAFRVKNLSGSMVICMGTSGEDSQIVDINTVKFNFVGKLLGPRGNSLKRLQEETLTKMSILGKGSMRDKTKEEELRKSGEAKYFHLNDDLHVLIEVFAPPAEAYARMGHALEEIKKFLIPDYNDEIRQAQLQELTYLNGGSENADVPVVRGKPTLRTRGVPTPTVTRGRGGVTARPVGVGVPRGTPTARGVLSTRGPVSRGRGLLTPRARGVPPSGYRPPPPPPTQEAYTEYDYDDGYGTAYDGQSYDSYDNSYSTPAQSGAGYYDYGHGLSEETYDSYGQDEWTNSRHKAPSARTTKGVYRDQPYGRY